MSRPGLGARDRELVRQWGSVVGVDEVGRGSLVGPVVVCGVRFSEVPDNPGVQDSKLLTARQREAASAWILAHAADWLMVEVWPEVIDRLNIRRATILAMECVIAGLRARGGGAVVVDGTDLAGGADWLVCSKRADSSFFAVAAASILAKVHRDDLLVQLAARHPFWQWDRNKGYGSRGHREALQKHGRTYLHRRSFAVTPVLP